MNFLRSVVVLVVAAGTTVTLSNGAFGHEESHGEHKSHEQGHHEEHHEEHHDGHHGEHHEEHHDGHHHDHHDDHHDHHDHHDGHHDHGHHWWHHPTIDEFNAWTAGWGLSTPFYYDYGPQGNVVYRSGNVYIDGKLAGAADAYATSAFALANASRAPKATDDDANAWLPLGTFAVSPNHGDRTSTQTLQLAINKSGEISGVLLDLPKGTATPTRGSLDRATQRVAFGLGAKSGMVAETGLYNLTKDKVNLLVHKRNAKAEHYTLSRFETPPAGELEDGPSPKAKMKP